MQHLLRKQIITGALLLCISFASLAQRGEVYQPFHDELPYYLGMSIGLNNNSLNFNRNIDFMVNEWLYDNLYLWLTIRVSRVEHNSKNIIKNRNSIHEKRKMLHYKSVSELVAKQP